MIEGRPSQQRTTQSCSQIKGDHFDCCQQKNKLIFLKKNRQKFEVFLQNLSADGPRLLNSDIGLFPKQLECFDDRVTAIFDEKYLGVFEDNYRIPLISRHTSGLIRSVLKQGDIIFLTDDCGTLSASLDHSEQNSCCAGFDDSKSLASWAV